jgi:hypothetical protein
MMRAQLTAQPSPQDKKKVAPPVIVFVWGRFTFKGVIDSLSQKYTMFLSDGTPVRAEVALKIRNVWDPKFEDDSGQFKSNAQVETRQYQVQQGDRLDLIAATQLGDPNRGPEIAALNNLDDPLKLPATLQLPTR